MCGRYVFYMPPQDLKRRLGLENLINFPGTYNAAPIQDQAIVIKNRMGLARWGFSPPWAKEDNTTMAAKMINARSETLMEKPSFRETWQKQRLCLVPANGFYEWVRNDETGTKQPHYIHSRNDNILYFGGLWSKVFDQVTFTILTKAASDTIKSLHHRMPVMVLDSQIKDWFSGDIKKAHNIVAQATADELIYHPVNSAVGKVSNDEAHLIEKLSA